MGIRRGGWLLPPRWVARESICWRGGLRSTVPAAATAALLYALAPSRLYTVFDQPDGVRVLFWSLVPFLLLSLDVSRRKPRAAALLFVASITTLLLATLPDRPRSLDALAAAELALVGLVSLWPPFGSPRARGICFAVFVSCAAWAFALRPHYSFRPAPMPPGAIEWIDEHSQGARVFGPVFDRRHGQSRVGAGRCISFAPASAARTCCFGSRPWRSSIS